MKADFDKINKICFYNYWNELNIISDKYAKYISKENKKELDSSISVLEKILNDLWTLRELDFIYVLERTKANKGWRYNPSNFHKNNVQRFCDNLDDSEFSELDKYVRQIQKLKVNLQQQLNENSYLFIELDEKKYNKIDRNIIDHYLSQKLTDGAKFYLNKIGHSYHKIFVVFGTKETLDVLKENVNKDAEKHYVKFSDIEVKKENKEIIPIYDEKVFSASSGITKYSYNEIMEMTGGKNFCYIVVDGNTPLLVKDDLTKGNKSDVTTKTALNFYNVSSYLSFYKKFTENKDVANYGFSLFKLSFNHYKRLRLYETKNIDFLKVLKKELSNEAFQKELTKSLTYKDISHDDWYSVQSHSRRNNLLELYDSIGGMTNERLSKQFHDVIATVRKIHNSVYDSQYNRSTIYSLNILFCGLNINYKIDVYSNEHKINSGLLDKYKMLNFIDTIYSANVYAISEILTFKPPRQK